MGRGPWMSVDEFVELPVPQLSVDAARGLDRMSDDEMKKLRNFFVSHQVERLRLSIPNIKKQLSSFGVYFANEAERLKALTLEAGNTSDVANLLSRNNTLKELELLRCEATPNSKGLLVNALRNSSITKLTITGSNLPEEELATLLQIKTLKEFYVNEWEPSEVAAFSNALKNNTTLEKFGLKLAYSVGGYGDDERPVEQVLNPGLFEFLLTNKTLTHLSVKAVVDPKDWDRLPICLQNNHSLTSLTLDWHGANASQIVKTIETNNSISELNLFINHTQVSSDLENAFAAALEKNNSLTKLFLNGPSYNLVAKILTVNAEKLKLTHLDLDNYHNNRTFPDEFYTSLARNESLLDFSMIVPEDGRRLVDSLPPNLTHLKLILSYRDGLMAETASYLRDVLAARDNLQSLDLNAEDEPTVQKVIAASWPVSSLKLRLGRLDGEGLQQLSSFAETNENLHKLSILGCNFNWEQMASFLKSLNVKQSVDYLWSTLNLQGVRASAPEIIDILQQNYGVLACEIHDVIDARTWPIFNRNAYVKREGTRLLTKVAPAE